MQKFVALICDGWVQQCKYPYMPLVNDNSKRAKMKKKTLSDCCMVEEEKKLKSLLMSHV